MSEQIIKKRPNYVIIDGFCLSPWIYPPAYRSAVNTKPRKDDVILVAFPRCGTNWVQQVIHLLRNKGEPYQNYGDFMRESPILELAGTENIKLRESPRFYRSHLPCNLLPYSQEAKYVWVVRNPKDCLVSFYHYTKCALYDYVDGDFNDYFEIFINGENNYGDYFDHVLSWYEHRYDSNVLPLYYENLKKDFKGSIRQIAQFLGREYEDMIKDELLLNKILSYSTVDYMNKTIGANLDPGNLWQPEVDIDSLELSEPEKHFHHYAQKRYNQYKGPMMQVIRQGIVGNWREVLSESQNNAMNKKIEEKLKDTELLKFWKENNLL